MRTMSFQSSRSQHARADALDRSSPIEADDDTNTQDATR
jgi:hypothetical protein